MTPKELEQARQRISVRLKSDRKRLKITQQALAKASGLCVRTINSIETGVRAWDVDSQIIYEIGLQKLTVL